MFKDFLILILGLCVLVFAADQFLSGTSRLAERFNIPKVLVGALIVGFATSAPEFAASLTAVFQEETGGVELAVGNVVGSNVANLGLVLALPILIWGGIRPPRGTKEQAGYSFIGVLVFSVVVYSNLNSAVGGVLLSSFFCLVITFIIRDFKGFEEHPSHSFVNDNRSVSRDIIVTIIGLLLTIFSPRWIVSSAMSIGSEFGWEGGFIGFSLVAIGTSLPELVTSLVGARRGEWGLIIGNLFGSNLFNSLGVGSTILFAHAGLGRPSEQLHVNLLVLIGMCLLSLVAFLGIRKPVEISRRYALLLLFIYALLFWQMARTLTG